MNETKTKWRPAHNDLVRKWMKPKQKWWWISGAQESADLRHSRIGGFQALKNRWITSAQESADERMEARLLGGAEWSCLTEEENKVALREVGPLKNGWLNEWSRVCSLEHNALLTGKEGN